ncbi:hypothetical protein, partial [Luteimonas sp. FCS-9]|uniref:hypothetical protein n=1 Tax=Luteimonas sp. FCS-9 TaxID=1547516 RepID=UPI001E651967
PTVSGSNRVGIADLRTGTRSRSDARDAGFQGARRAAGRDASFRPVHAQASPRAVTEARPAAR